MIDKATLETLIAVSPRVSRMPRDRRGLPIPSIVLRDDQGNPDFIVNDTRLQHRALARGLCSVCGEQMGEGDVWFIGGQASGLDPMGCYNDSPVHHECGQFSLQVCPYLAVRAHKGMKPVAKESVLQRLVDGGRVSGFIDPTVDTSKPASYVLGRVTGFVIVATPDGLGYKLIPNRPFAALEEWSDGQMLARADTPEGMAVFRQRGLAMMAARGMTLFTLPPLFQASWTGAFAGMFPWRRD